MLQNKKNDGLISWADLLKGISLRFSLIFK